MCARRVVLPVAGLVAVAIAGCGGGGGGTTSSTTSSGGSSAAGSETLRLSAGPGSKLRFDKKTLEAKAGKVAIVMSNPSELSHSVAIEGGGVNVAGEVVAPGGTSTASADLKPGTYTFFCTVPGHREGGMEGTLTVT
jgi:uncharacterized cupredoxin-like copper-binding protein